MEKQKIETVAMDLLKSKWSHLYINGEYPIKPYPTNYENDLNNVMLGILTAEKESTALPFKKVPNKLRVSHFPQVPCKPFTVEVTDEIEAKRIIDVITFQHLFLFQEKIIPDFANVIAVEMYDENFDGEGNAGYCDYFNEEEGMDWDEMEATYLNKYKPTTNFKSNG